MLENGRRQELDFDLDIDIDLASQYTRITSKVDALCNALGARRYYCTSRSKTTSIGFEVQR